VNRIWNGALNRFWQDFLELLWNNTVAGCVRLATLGTGVVNVVWKGFLETLWDLLLCLFWDYLMLEGCN
jgi:hypothetical protein